MPWSCHMNGAAFTECVVLQKNTRAVVFGFKSVFTLNIVFADLAVGDVKMTGNSVDVFGSNVKRGIFEPIATITGTKIAIYFVVKLCSSRSMHASPSVFYGGSDEKLFIGSFPGPTYLYKMSFLAEPFYFLKITKNKGENQIFRSGSSNRKVRLLVAEDNSIHQQVVIGILRKLGYAHVDAVANGRETLSALEKYKYDLILMDVQMPYMDGIEVTKKIRSKQSSAEDNDIPIIALTAHAMDKDRDRCLKAGMNDYIAKPIAPQTLAKVMQKQLKRSKQRNIHGMLLAKTTRDVEKAEESTEVFFFKELEARILNDTALARTIIEEFIKDMGRQMDNLQQSAAENDMVVFKKRIHKMKGSAANVGARGIQEVIEDIEYALTQDEKSAEDMLPDYIERIAQSWKAVHKEMRRYINRK